MLENRSWRSGFFILSYGDTNAISLNLSETSIHATQSLRPFSKEVNDLANNLFLHLKNQKVIISIIIVFIVKEVHFMSIISAFIMPHPPIILPTVGKGEEKKIQATITACQEVARTIAQLNPDTIIIATPHMPMYADYFHIASGKTAQGNLSAFGAKDSMQIEYDEEFIENLCSLTAQENFPAGIAGEKDPQLDHATFIPLSFVNECLTNYKVVRIGLSGLDVLKHYQLGKYISTISNKLQRKTVFLASGDLSHKLTADGPYGFSAEGVAFDQEITTAINDGDFLKILNIDPELCSQAAECGHKSFVIMSGALDGKALQPTLHSYQGNFGVGYAVASFDVTGDDASRHFDKLYKDNQTEKLLTAKQNESEYVRLARLSLETYIKTGKQITPPANLPGTMLTQKSGVFVSLKKFGQLRGCIGTISPTTDSVANEIISNAISSGSKDFRFAPVRKEELNDLVYSVDLLCTAEPATSLEDLDPKKYGVIVSSGYRRGLLLPNLAGIDTPAEQIAIALEKAGIQKNESYSLERFEVVRHQ